MPIFERPCRRLLVHRLFPCRFHKSVLADKVQVLLDPGQWSPQGPAGSQAARAERKDGLKGCSASWPKGGALLGEGQVLPGPGR